MTDSLPRLGPCGGYRPKPTIVHLGLGAFFRAHIASYLDDLGNCGVIGVSLRSPDIRNKLAPQDWVYTAAELSPDRTKTRQYEILRDILVAPENPEKVLAAMVNPDVDIVSLTITEKGYCHDPATGRLNLNHPDIVHDIANQLPRSAPGFLVRALAARWQSGAPPFTILCCDNLPSNGSLVRNVVIALARQIDPKLADWIAANAAFPATMVDRIVPATTDDDVKTLSRLAGHYDAAPVKHEPFRQWVIEDNFVLGKRPAFETVGVQMVDDVAPYEHMKLRMLNGAHSALSYLGYLAGLRTIADTVADPVVARYLRGLWAEEIAPTVIAPDGIDLSQYADALLDRFANPSIQHATWQIAMDGSQKIPQRLLAPLSERSDSSPRLLLAIAGWIRYVRGKTDKGEPIDVRDPLAMQLRAATSDDPAETVRNILGFEDIFEPALTKQIAAPLTTVYTILSKGGAIKAMTKLGLN